jgi:hypothetical protein
MCWFTCAVFSYNPQNLTTFHFNELMSCSLNVIFAFGTSVICFSNFQIRVSFCLVLCHQRFKSWLTCPSLPPRRYCEIFSIFKIMSLFFVEIV